MYLPKLSARRALKCGFFSQIGFPMYTRIRFSTSPSLGRTRDEDPDGSVEFGPPHPDPLLFSLDPDLDPTCNNGLIKLF